MLLSEGQMSDCKGAALMIDALPRAKALLADRGYDADWFRAALAERGIAACIPSKANRKVPIPSRYGALPPAPQNREHVRQTQGLATDPHPL
jgi:transposase